MRIRFKLTLLELKKGLESFSLTFTGVLLLPTLFGEPPSSMLDPYDNSYIEGWVSEYGKSIITSVKPEKEGPFDSELSSSFSPLC